MDEKVAAEIHEDLESDGVREVMIADLPDSEADYTAVGVRDDSQVTRRYNVDGGDVSRYGRQELASTLANL